MIYYYTPGNAQNLQPPPTKKRTENKSTPAETQKPKLRASNYVKPKSYVANQSEPVNPVKISKSAAALSPNANFRDFPAVSAGSLDSIFEINTV